MRIDAEPVWFDIASDLLEEVLQAALETASSSEREAFEREREAIASIEIVDIREERFRDFDRQWARRFNVTSPLRAALDENEALEVAIEGCVVDRVRLPEDEKVILYASGEAGKETVLLMSLTAKTLLDRAKLAMLLREVSILPAD